MSLRQLTDEQQLNLLDGLNVALQFSRTTAFY